MSVPLGRVIGNPLQTGETKGNRHLASLCAIRLYGVSRSVD